MTIWKRLAATGCALLLAVMSGGCSADKTSGVPAYEDEPEITRLGSGVVAENDRYQLLWDENSACILLHNRISGHVWSTIPYDFYKGGEGGSRADSQLRAPINVVYITSSNRLLKRYNGSRVMKEGKYSARLIEGGVEVTYYFDPIRISVPVQYLLREDSVAVRIDPSGIREGSEQVYQIEIAPFFTGVKNREDDASYVFVPSGGGAVMYTGEEGRGAREYEEPVYGADPIVMRDTVTAHTADICLPVFGVNAGGQALLGIIEEGAEACTVKATAGDNTIGYSAAYAVFGVRGYNTTLVEMSNKSSRRVNLYAETMTQSTCTVGYYPLEDTDAGYTGMAARYRRYLADTCGLGAVQTAPLYLQVLGGKLTEQSALGIPYRAMTSATTLKQAEGIVRDLMEQTQVAPVVQLKGFGASGLDTGKVGGGYTIHGKLGSYADYRVLQELCESYLDVELLRFNGSGGGFSALWDTAKSSNGEIGYQYTYALAMGNRDEDAGRYTLLARGKLATAADKLKKWLQEEKNQHVSLSSLGSLAYSDYSDSRYFCRGGMEDDVQKIMGGLSDTGVTLLTETAYAYAAAGSRHVIAAPVHSSKYTVLDADIPFYQMVFKGSVSLSGAAINLAADPRSEFLRTIESGSGLLFSVCQRYDGGFREHGPAALAGSVYADNREAILSWISEAKAYLEAVSGAHIETHGILSEGVVQTGFDNGVIVVVNYTDQVQNTPLGPVDAQSFIYR